MESNKIVAIFADTVTGDKLESIRTKHQGLVHDFSNEAEFKAARKISTEMNKLLKAVDRVGIDAAKQVSDLRNELKDKIEDAYSGTVAPFDIENQRRKDEANRIKQEEDRKIAEQRQILNMMKGASQRALHLPFDDIEQILDDVMNVDLSQFEGDMQQEAQFAKDVSLAQLSDALKFATEKENMRKEKEMAAAMLGDKDDEIARLKAMLAEKEAEPVDIHALQYTLDDALNEWYDNNNTLSHCEFIALKDKIEQFTSLAITE